MEIRDNRDKEWFWLDNQYLNGYAKYLGMSCTVVYLSLCRFANNNTQQCFPSMETIADQNGVHRATVLRAIKKLEEWGIIKIEKSKKPDGTQANNVYTLLSKKEWKDKPSSNKQHGETELQKVIEPSSNKYINRVAQSDNNNTNINYTNNNNTSEQSSQVSFLIKSFEKINPNCKTYYGNTTQRKALQFLIEEYGFEKVEQIIENVLPKTNNMDYMPKITTPYLLKEKWSSLEANLKTLKAKTSKNKIAF